MFSGHLARTTPEEDHHRVIAAALRPPAEWRRIRSPENYLAEDNCWWPSVLELRDPHGLEEGKRQGRLALIRQLGNTPLWSSPIKKKKKCMFRTYDCFQFTGIQFECVLLHHINNKCCCVNVSCVLLLICKTYTLLSTVITVHCNH